MLPLDAFEITVSPEGKIDVCGKKGGVRALNPREFEFREYRMGEYCVAVCFWKQTGKMQDYGRWENEGIDY